MVTFINDCGYPFYYYNKCKYSTTKIISREGLFNYKDIEMI